MDVASVEHDGARDGARAPLRIGIVGSGFIAGVIARAIAATRDVTLVAVASRRREHAAAFSATHGNIRVFGSWEELVAWDGLDAVYVATPTAVREPICLAAAQQRKHVLAEKPFASVESLRMITEACHVNGVAFMDATHFTHHPRTQQLREELAERVGRVRAINSCFYFPTTDRRNIRLQPAHEPTGAIGDMAWYALRAVVEFADAESELVQATGFGRRDAGGGAVVHGAGVLLLSDGCTATWDAGYDAGTTIMDLVILGEHGIISLDDFVLDWAGGFPVSIPDYPVGFTQRVGVVNPSGYDRVVTPTDVPQAVRTVQAFLALTREPASDAVSASMRLSERTQGMLDAVWNGLVVG